MINILDVILFKYPGIQQVSYWNTQYDGTEWNSPIDGLIWENTTVPKPTQQELDDLMPLYCAHKAALEANNRVKQQLADIDMRSIRALRSKDTAKLAALENEAVALRAQLK
jgi:hypothetical protein